MKTTNENLNKALNNAFIIERISTKHVKSFKFNRLVRPMTISTLFQILAHQKIEKSMNDCHIMMCSGNFAEDYHTNYKSSVRLSVSLNYATIEFKNSEHLNINLSFEKLCKMFNWLKDESIYTTDFNGLTKDEKYYN